MNIQLKTFSSKKSLSMFAAALFALSSFGASVPANAVAADPEMTTPPVFSVTGNILTLSQDSAWTDGTIRTIQSESFMQQAYACSSAIATAGTGTVGSSYREQILSFQQCSRLATNQSGTTPFVSGDMANIYYDYAGGFGTLLSARDRFDFITLVSSVIDSDGNIVYAYQPTVAFSYTPVAPTLITAPTNSISDSVLTYSMGTWSNGTPDGLVRACSSAMTAITTPQSSFLPGCIGVYDSPSPGPLSGAPIDLETAYVFDGMSGSVPYLDFIASAGNSSYVHFIAFSDAWFDNSPYYLYPDSVEYVPAGSSPSSPASSPVATPYTGPVVQAPGALKPVAPGEKLVLSGSNLSGVSKATINGFDAGVKVTASGDIEIVVPKGLPAGTYDLVINSDSGLLTIQDAIKVSESSVDAQTSPVDPSTRLKEDNTVKVYVFDVLGAGKVQIFFNGKEVVWVNAEDESDPKLTNDYLVRTLNLLSGKNIIEIYVDGKRVDRKAYTKVDDDSKI